MANPPGDDELPDWLDSTTAADAVGAQWALPSFIQSVQPVERARRCVGRAATALASLDDNGVLRQVLETPASADILCIAGAAWSRTSVIGDLFARELHDAGYRALVTDGPIRDAATIATLALSVWSRGTTTPASTKADRGHVGIPVSMGGVTVCPGDLVVADAGGVVVWPAARVAECLAAATEKHERDAARLAGITARAQASQPCASGRTGTSRVP